MQPVFASGSRRSVAQLVGLRRAAMVDKAPRVVLPIQGILMSLEGRIPGEIARTLKVHRSTVPLWIDQIFRRGS